MKKSLLILLTLVLCFGSSAQARRRSLSEMKSAVRAAFSDSRIVGPRKASTVNVSVDNMNLVREESQLSVLSGSGHFAVVANDDAFNAILAIADTQFDDKSLENPGLRWWMQAMNESLEYYMQTGTRPQRVAIPASVSPSVESFVETRWNQSAPYFNMTPEYSDGKKTTHFVTGCVATAMAQCMKVYNYPETGQGKVSYRCKMYYPDGTEGSELLAVSFKGGNYDWANMLNVYGSTYTTTQADAVAKLMYHLGVSVQMDYDKSGSGSYTFKAVDALITYFKYPQTMRFYSRTMMNIEEWMQIVFTHLSQKHPILYGAQSKSGGHEFVLDGYTTAGLVHVNWGWGGSSDGVFDINTLNGYDSGQDMVPIYTESQGSEFSLFGAWGQGISYSLNYVGNLNASCSYVANGSHKAFTGSFALLAESEDGKITVLSSQSKSCQGFGYELKINGFNASFSGISVNSLADGKYRVYMASKADTELNWQPVRSHESYSNSAILTMAGGKGTLTTEKNSGWTGINSIEQDFDSDASRGVFSIDGSRVSDFTRHGLYIQNGRKVMK